MRAGVTRETARQRSQSGSRLWHLVLCKDLTGRTAPAERTVAACGHRVVNGVPGQERSPSNQWRVDLRDVACMDGIGKFSTPPLVVGPIIDDGIPFQARPPVVCQRPNKLPWPAGARDAFFVELCSPRAPTRRLRIATALFWFGRILTDEIRYSLRIQQHRRHPGGRRGSCIDYRTCAPEDA